MKIEKNDEQLEKKDTGDMNFDLEQDFETSQILKRLNNNNEKQYEQTINDELSKNESKSEKLNKFDYFKDKEIESNINDEEKLDNSYKVATSETIVQLKNVGLKYGRDVVLKDVSISINKGEFVYLVGESGAGKSTIIKLLYKEVTNNEGKLIIDKEDVTKMRKNRLHHLRRKVGVIFQDFRLLPDKTVYENVRFSLDVTNYPRTKRKKRVHQVLKQVGVFDKKDKYPDELSGGQQQRVAIARAIVDEPMIIVADEPTGNLDPENAIGIMEILSKVNLEGTTIIMATHDVGIVNSYKQRVILMKDGNIMKEVKGEYIYE